MMRPTFVSLAALLAAGLAHASAPDPELLSKLAAHQGRLDALEAKAEVLMNTRIEEVNGKGEVVSVWESLMKSHREAGEEKRELVRAMKDGKDVTEERKKQLAEDGGTAQKNQVQMAKSPFAAAEQGRYEFTSEGTVEGGLEKIAFEPKEKGPDVGVGAAVVDPKAGEVVRMEFAPAKLPTFVSKSDISVDFGNVTTAGRAPSTMKFVGEGGFLFLKKRARGTVTLDYMGPGVKPEPVVAPAQVQAPAPAPIAAPAAAPKAKAKKKAAAPRG